MYVWKFAFHQGAFSNFLQFTPQTFIIHVDIHITCTIACIMHMPYFSYVFMHVCFSGSDVKWCFFIYLFFRDFQVADTFVDVYDYCWCSQSPVTF